VKFTRLRLTGFKSFVDPTELAIEEGLTGIVGPNGCGKSNVVEALRWVMGETSAKSLRGKGMEDVIFSGTANRPERNMAEVVLCADNSDRTAPPHFNESDDLEISRRIEREAGSAYRVNGLDVRMRDVQTLFADLSTGAHSTAMVRQGQISQIINAKPQDRRKILEEAAGISGLHSRRHQAELRLKAAESNILRVDDVLQQLEQQLASLKRQARQANRYKNLSGLIREAEAIFLHLRWTDAEAASNKAAEQLHTIEGDVATCTGAVAAANSAQEQAAEKLPALREEEAKAAAALHRLTVERDQLDAEEERARAQIAKLEALLAHIAEDLSRETERVKDSDEVIDRLSTEAREIREAAEGQEANAKQLESAAASARAGLGGNEARLDELTRELADKEAARTALTREISQFENQAAQVTEELAHTREELTTLEREGADPEVLAAANGKHEDAAAAQTHAERLAQEAEEAHKVASAAEREAREVLSRENERVGAIKAEAKALSDLLSGDADAGLWPKLIDKVTVEPGYEKALGAALGDDLEAPDDDAAPVHWRNLGELHGGIGLPDGVSPLSSRVQAPGALGRALSQIGIVSRDRGAALQSQLKPGQRLVSTEGDFWRWDGFTAAAEAPTAAAQRLAQRNRLADLDATIAEEDAKLRDIRERYHALRTAGEDAAARETETRKALREAQAATNAARDALAEAERTANRHAARLAALREAETRLLATQERAAEGLAEARDALAGMDDIDTIRTQIVEAREATAEARNAYTQAQAAFDAHRREVETQTARLSGIESEIADWTRRRDAARGQITSLEERKAAALSEREAAEQIPLAVAEKRKALLGAFEAAEKERGEAGDHLAAAEAHLKIADEALRTAQSALSEARESRARIEATLEGAKGRQEEIADRIKEVLGCTPDKVLEAGNVEVKGDFPELDKIESRVERLKRERENMGAVNLRADQESEEVGAQLEQLSSERQELEEAIAKLRQGISTLNKEGRERLLGAFETVGQNFERLFTELFGGGTAQLRLVESEDPLEAGLEIFARPPGKRLQSMSLLSGGEQALTAMALIFAVFLVNPAPICVLDEVDAPLDDANVERFCNLLTEIKGETGTRFLIITHHALTMSRMDRLFGVTMAERGVSQLVSLDLASAEELAATG